jgi:hypothetical protein
MAHKHCRGGNNVGDSAMSNRTMLIKLTAMAIAAAAASFNATAASIYADALDATFESEDKTSERIGYFKCELNLAIAKPPNGVNLRAKLFKNGKTVIATATVDAGEFTMSNGIPYNPRKIAITDPSILSNIFETTSQMPRTDMGDGGFAISFTGEQFAALLTTIVRGDYMVIYLPKGATERTVWVVHDGVNAKAFGQFNECIKKML